MPEWLGLACITACAEGTKDLVSKKTMRRAGPLFVAWALVTVAAPFLVAIALALPLPVLGTRFLPAISATILLFVCALLLYMRALQAADLSLALPMIALTPAWMLLTGPLVLGEWPEPMGLAGVVTIVCGAYLLKLEDAKRGGAWAPFRALVRNPGTRAMALVACIFSLTATTAKLAISESSPLFAMASLYVGSAIVLTICVIARGAVEKEVLRRSWKSVLIIGLLVTVSEVCLAYSLSMALAVYVISVKRVSILVGAALGLVVFKERHGGSRLLGAAVMLAGLALIALRSG